MAKTIKVMFQMWLIEYCKVASSNTTLLRPYYIANRTRKILISNIHLLSPQKWPQLVDFNIEKVFPRGQP